MQPNTAKQNNHKFTKHYKIYAVVFAIFCFVLMVNKSIWAQIESIYNSSNDDIAGISSLMSAVSNNDIEGVKFFSKAGPIIINQKNIGGATALHIACRQANAEIVKILLENGASINIADNEGWTPLMRASLVANPEIVEMLIKKGAKADDFNSLGETAIVHATSSRCTQCLNIIIEHGNLLKTANLKTLKTQITDAFLVARNQEEQATKHILESFLDYVSKAEELANKSKESITAVDYIAESEPEEAPKKLSKKSKLKQDTGDKPSNIEAKKASKTPAKVANVPNKKFVLKNGEEVNKKSPQKISQINQKITDYSQNSEVKSTALPQTTNIDTNSTKPIINDTAQTQDEKQNSIKTKTTTESKAQTKPDTKTDTQNKLATSESNDESQEKLTAKTVAVDKANAPNIEKPTQAQSNKTNESNPKQNQKAESVSNISEQQKTTTESKAQTKPDTKTDTQNKLATSESNDESQEKLTAKTVAVDKANAPNIEKPTQAQSNKTNESNPKQNQKAESVSNISEKQKTTPENKTINNTIQSQTIRNNNSQNALNQNDSKLKKFKFSPVKDQNTTKKPVIEQQKEQINQPQAPKTTETPQNQPKIIDSTFQPAKKRFRFKQIDSNNDSENNNTTMPIVQSI